MLSVPKRANDAMHLAMLEGKILSIRLYNKVVSITSVLFYFLFHLMTVCEFRL